MKLLREKDKKGWLRQAFVKNNMSRSEIDQGIPHNPPDIRELDWSNIQKEINNLLVERQVITVRDINENNNLLSNTILKVILPKIIQLYKEQDSLKVKEK